MHSHVYIYIYVFVLARKNWIPMLTIGAVGWHLNFLDPVQPGPQARLNAKAWEPEGRTSSSCEHVSRYSA